MTSIRSSSGRGDGVQSVGGGDEHDVAQVHRNFQVVVPVGFVLLRIQHFQQSGAGVSPGNQVLILSTSSSSNTGFMLPAWVRAVMIRPGMAPT